MQGKNMEREWLFDDEHRMFRETVRKWVAAELAPYADEWEKKGEFPIELFRRAGELGFFAGGLPENYGGVCGDFRYVHSDPRGIWLHDGIRGAAYLAGSEKSTHWGRNL
jgi:alkylation response protein AidB-like acyl-CoA dehydrogenase